MEAGCDASTKRPLLEEAEVDAVLPAVEGASARTARARRRAGPSVGEEQDELLLQDTGQPETSVVIEMQSLATQEPPEEPPEPAAAGAEVGQSSGSGDRQCFICLQDGDKENPLIPCCSTCYARTHVRCWREWRNNQRSTALRSRLLGLRTQTNHLLRCTICKSGTAVLAGEEGALGWMNDLLRGGGDGGAARTPLVGIPRPHDDSDEDRDANLQDLVDMRTCIALVVYLVVLVVVLLVACLLIVMPWKYYAGDVVLCCIIALYELAVLQIVVLTVAQRRAALLAAAGGRGSSFGPATDGQAFGNVPVPPDGQAFAPAPINTV